MPFIERPSAAMTFNLLDETGSRATVSFDIPVTTLADAALTGANAMRALLASITGCAVVSQAVTYSQFDTTPELPKAGSRVERKGVFVFRTAAGKTASYQVPGIEGNMVLKTGRVDEDSPEVAAFVNGIIVAGAIFSDSNGVDIVSLSKAYERYRRTTRTMLPSSRTPDADIIADN